MLPIEKALTPFLIAFFILLSSEIIFHIATYPLYIIFIFRLLFVHLSLLLSTYLIYSKRLGKFSFHNIDSPILDLSLIFGIAIMYFLTLAYILINLYIEMMEVPLLSTFKSVTFILKSDKNYLFILAFWAVFINSTVEELYFRKYLIDCGYSKLSILLFTIWHFYLNVGGILLAFFMAITLLKDYEKNKSYIRVVILHAFVNIFMGLNFILFGMF